MHRLLEFFTWRRRSKSWPLLAIALLIMAGVPCIAHAAPADEYEVKAVFLFNFARFVDWPEDSFPTREAPVVIGVVGTDPFGSRLDDAVRDEKVRERPIIVRRFRKFEDVSDCHILFISKSERSRMQSMFTRMKGRSVLTVSDIENFAASGGMIGFVMEAEKIRLQINLASAKSASLTVSSKLLRPSEVIGPDRGQLQYRFRFARRWVARRAPGSARARMAAIKSPDV